MNLKPIASNMTQVTLENGTQILFSYQTPVAIKYLVSDRYYRAFSTEKKWSSTTTRHISKWYNKTEGVLDIVGQKPQEFFDHLVSEVNTRV